MVDEERSVFEDDLEVLDDLDAAEADLDAEEADDFEARDSDDSLRLDDRDAVDAEERDDSDARERERELKNDPDAVCHHRDLAADSELEADFAEFDFDAARAAAEERDADT